MSIQQRLITITEFENYLAQHTDGLYELIHGAIVEKVPTQEHGVIATKIAGRLDVFLDDNEIAGHVAVEARFRPLDATHNDRMPDVSVHFTDAPVVKTGAVIGMPDIAIEIKSPTDTFTLMRDKATYYINNGVKMVWLVYPEKHMVEIYQPDSDIQILLEDDTILGGTVLRDFKLALAKIFPKE